MTCPLGLPKGAGSQREHFLLLFQRGALHPFEERVESRRRALAWGMDGEAAAPSPLLLLPAPSSWGPQGSHEVFLGPTGQMPWAPVGGGVWGLVRVPPLCFPLLLRGADKNWTLIKHLVPGWQVVRPGLCGFGYLGSVGRQRVLGSLPLRNERDSDSKGPGPSTSTSCLHA